MLGKSIKSQIRISLFQKEIYITLLILCIFAAANYFGNVFEYRGLDVVNMYAPYKLITISEYASNFRLFLIYPLIVVLPMGMSFCIDRDSREINYLSVRFGLKQYYFGKLITAFLITFIVFTIPFLFEFGINCIAFPLKASGDESNIPYYDTVEAIKNYAFPTLYVKLPYLHCIIGIFLWGISAGIWGAFAMAVSLYIPKFRLFVFIPVYLIHTILGRLDDTVFNSLGFEILPRDYMVIHNGINKNYPLYLMFMALLAAISIIITWHKSRRDMI